MNFHVAARNAVQVLVRQEKKIDAIKHHRALTGAGWVEARAAVERLQEGA